MRPFYMSGVDIDDMRNRLGISVSALESWYFADEQAKRTLKEHFKVASLEGLGLNDYDCGVIAAGAHSFSIFTRHRKIRWTI